MDRSVLLAEIKRLLKGLAPQSYMNLSKVSTQAALAAVAKMNLGGIGVQTLYRFENWRACFRCQSCREGNPWGCHFKSLAWVEECYNRVVTAGLNELLDATFKTGNAAPAHYVGLVGASVSDAAITSALTTLTSASNPWVAADAGSSIIVRGAGAAGADLVTTIATFNGAGSVELTAAAGTTVTNAGALWEARAADTMASHSPWTEIVPYSDANRPTFTAGTISGGSVDNSAAKAAFNINATATVYGGFLADDNTKSGAVGILYGMAPFTTAARAVLSGDTLNVTVTLTVQNG